MRRRGGRSALIACVLLVAAACGRATDETTSPGGGGADHTPIQADAVAPEGVAPVPDDAATAPDSDSPPAHDAEVDPLMNPDSPAMNATAPERFRVRFETTRGDFLVEVHRQWAPRGADRFYNLVRHGFFDGAKFFRVVDGFVVQFGIAADPAVSAAWADATIGDDPRRESNLRGRLTFAHAGPNTRTTQLFINLRDNPGLDGQGFPPFGEVVEGMEVVDGLYAGYGDGPPYGSGPDQGRIEAEGNAYLEREFPRLDGIRTARIEAEG